ncbi:MAG: hypothetical protein GXY86_13245 [Firmicutes bacterium]|nr:hypothetical protein [Bacillota bacterium]
MGEWLPISELFDFEKGSLQSSKCVPGSYNFITAAEEWKTHETFTHDCEALVFAMAASGSLGRTHYVKGKFIASDLCFILQPKKDKKLDLKFYYRVFNFLREDIVKKTATGTSKLAINQTNFGKYMLPYFDIEHQLKFSEKLDSISFIKNDLINRFDDQSKYLSQLRQSILQEAIEGKLTADWRKQNPVRKGDPNTDAAALLEKIKLEKEKMIAEGKIKKEKPLEPIKPEEIPFELPEGWIWCRFGNYAYFERGKFSIRPRNDKSCYGGKYPFIQIGSLSNNGDVVRNFKQTLNEKGFAASKQFEKGTIAIAIVGGTIGNLGVLGLDMCFPDSMVGIRPTLITNQDYILLLLRSKQSEIRKSAYQMAGQPNIKLPTLTELIIPLPPLSEQKAIVNRVNNLLNTVDELKQQVSDRKEQAEELMRAILREAFEGRVI